MFWPVFYTFMGVVESQGILSILSIGSINCTNVRRIMIIAIRPFGIVLGSIFRLKAIYYNV